MKNKMKTKTKIHFYFHFRFWFHFVFHFRFCFLFLFSFLIFVFIFIFVFVFGFLFFLVFVFKFYYGTSRPPYWSPSPLIRIEAPTYTISIAKTASKKIAELICSMKFFYSEVVFFSVNLAFDLHRTMLSCVRWFSKLLLGCVCVYFFPL